MSKKKCLKRKKRRRKKDGGGFNRKMIRKFFNYLYVKDFKSHDEGEKFLWVGVCILFGITLGLCFISFI